MEHNYVRPDDFKVPHAGVRLSNYHYFKADGLFSNGFHATGTFGYDGSTSTSTGYLDNTLITGSAREDSLLIYHRSNSGEEWQLVNGFTINYNVSHTDKKGSITVDTLKRGEYVFAVRDYSVVDVNELSASADEFCVFPNPTADVCHIKFRMSAPKGIIQVMDVLGKQVYSTEVFAHQESVDWDTFKEKQGIYFVQLIIEGTLVGQDKVIVEKK
jgi:hypothetical protein